MFTRLLSSSRSSALRHTPLANVRLLNTSSALKSPSITSYSSLANDNNDIDVSTAPKKWSRHVIGKESLQKSNPMKEQQNTIPQQQAQSPSQQQQQESQQTQAEQPKRRKRRTLKPLKAPITLTENAKSHLRALSSGPDPKLIRISVRNRGCSGLTYHLEYVNMPEKFDEIVVQDDIKIIIDSKALFSIIGSEMDWVDNKLSSKFVFKNPNSKGTCGCGESFMV